MLCELLTDCVTVKFIERSLANELALDRKAERTDPRLHPKHVAVSDNGAVRHHGVGSRRVLDASQQLSTQLGQRRHELRLEEALGAKLFEEKAAVFIIDLAF